MPIVTVEAIILQSFPFSDTSKILRLLTGTHGVRSVIAKGALRPKNRYGGVLEPFSLGVATLYLRESRDLQTLAAFELTTSQQELGRDLPRFAGASLIAEIVLRTGSEEPHAGLFQAVTRGIEHIRIVRTEALESTLLAVCWSLIGLLGFEPALDACLDCGRPVPDEIDSSFDYAAGGVRCAECAPGTPGRTVPAHARAALRAMAAGVAVPLDRTDGHWRLLRRYLDHHVLEGGTLRSLDFLEEALAQRSCVP